MTERATPRATIFLVDDDPTFRAVAKTVLGQVGEVRVFERAEAALEAAKTTPPDLVITDVVMEDVGGFEFLRRYSERFQELRTPFLFVSALGDDETLTQCLDAGADDYVAKPVSPAVLRSRAWALLRRSGSFDRGALTRAANQRPSVQLSTVAVNGHPLAIETRLVRGPSPAIVTIVKAGEREVVRKSLSVSPELDAPAIEQLRMRMHSEAESAMRDKVSSLRYQQQKERTTGTQPALPELPSLQALFDEGVDHALNARWSHALSCWERALAQDPDNAALRCNVEVARRKLASGS